MAETSLSTSGRTLSAIPEREGVERVVSDEELWHRFQQGEESAFTTIYDRYGNRVYAYERLLLSTAERSQLDDLFQDTWIKIYQQRERFDIKANATLAGWIFRVAHNTTVSALRRSKHLNSLDDAELSEETLRAITVDSSVVYSDELSSEEMMAHVLRMLERLPTGLREVFVLSELDRLSLKTIAETLGISRTNAKVRLFRARKLLRELLTPLLERLSG